MDHIHANRVHRYWRLRNLLAGGMEGGVTTHAGSGELMSVHDAAQRYSDEDVPLIVIVGKDYQLQHQSRLGREVHHDRFAGRRSAGGCPRGGGRRRRRDDELRRPLPAERRVRA